MVEEGVDEVNKKQDKDETGFFVVFSEQGASASHMSAAKFLDAVARMP